MIKIALILTLGLMMYIDSTSSQVYQICNGDCCCNGSTLLDADGFTAVGECLNKGKNNKKFCYVNHDSPCPDKKRSLRANGAFYSNNACENQKLFPAELCGPDVNGKEICED